MIKKVILFFFILLLNQPCVAQNYKVHDSILKKKVDSLVDVVASLWNKDLDSAEAMANYTLRYSKKHNYLRGIGQSYGTLAGVYNYQGKDGESIAYQIKSADIYESINDEILFAIANIGISSSLFDQEQYKEAEEYILKAHNFGLKTNNTKCLLSTYSILGAIGIKTNGSFEDIIKNLKKAEEFSREKKDLNWLTGILNMQGEAYVEKNRDLSTAVSLLMEAIQIIHSKDSRNHYNLGYSYLFLGKAYWKMKQYKKALQYNDSSLTHYKALNYNKGLRLTYENRKDILVGQGNYKQSIEVFQLFTKYKDSVFKKDQVSQIARMKTEYETDQIIIEKEKAEAKVKLAETISKQNKNYFVGSVIIAFLMLLSSVFYFKRLKIKRKTQLITLELKETQKRLVIEKQYRDSELKALKAQMNPHFIFNALNSIQDYIVLNQKNLASDYLGKFADLIRNYLHFSDTGFISIPDEIHNLNLYLELEKLRFEDVLEYTFNVEENANSESINIPTMLIQPYVENALKHGLLHRKDNRKLNISISKTSDKIIECAIEDNGIGREKSKAINQKREAKHKSFALNATIERLDLLNYGRDKKIGVTFIDIKDKGKATGTKVILKIPIIRK